jgi:hypothetical protein
MELFWPLAVVRRVHVGSLLVLFDAALFNLYDGPQPGDARAQAWLACVVGHSDWLLLDHRFSCGHDGRHREHTFDSDPDRAIRWVSPAEVAGRIIVCDLRLHFLNSCF